MEALRIFFQDARAVTRGGEQHRGQREGDRRGNAPGRDYPAGSGGRPKRHPLDARVAPGENRRLRLEDLFHCETPSTVLTQAALHWARRFYRVGNLDVVEVEFETRPTRFWRIGF